MEEKIKKLEMNMKKVMDKLEMPYEDEDMEGYEEAMEENEEMGSGRKKTRGLLAIKIGGEPKEGK